MAEEKARSDWMARGSFGIMVHWLHTETAPRQGEKIADLNIAVNRSDSKRLLDQIAECGADWLIFTIGQNTGHYVSPSATLDHLAGPGHCSARDLTLELAQGMHGMGKRFIAYIPCEVRGNPTVHEAFGWNTQDGTDQVEFQKRYTGFIREYAERLGELLDGWWFDGCYTWPCFHNSKLFWDDWYSAARAGNPDAVVTFNDGSLCCGTEKPIRPEHDYLAGETEVLHEGKLRLGRGKDASLYLPKSRFVEDTQCQWHALVPIDCYIDGTAGEGELEVGWCHNRNGEMSPPRYTDDCLFSFVRSCKSVGGAVTLNCGIYQEGWMGEQTVAQVSRLSETLAAGHA